MEFKIGYYEDIPYEDYAEIEAYRSHDLTTAIKCPYTWKYQKPLTETPALLEGRVQHTVFLEHHNFAKEFVIEPKIDKRTKAGKAEYEIFKKEIGNRRAISVDLYDTCMERRSVVQEYIPKKTDKIELTVCFEFCGQPFKSRFDWYDNEQIWDLKTCRDASSRGFIAAINNFKYHMQAGLYVHAARSVDLPCKGFSFLAQEKVHPYCYAVYEMAPEALEYGLAQCEQALDRILRCEADNEYKPFGYKEKQVIALENLY